MFWKYVSRWFFMRAYAPYKSKAMSICLPYRELPSSYNRYKFTILSFHVIINEREFVPHQVVYYITFFQTAHSHCLPPLFTYSIKMLIIWVLFYLQNLYQIEKILQIVIGLKWRNTEILSKWDFFDESIMPIEETKNMTHNNWWSKADF